MKQPWFHIVCELDGGPKPSPTIRDIQRAVCRRYAGITLMDLVSCRRGEDVHTPRHVAMYLAKALTLKSYPTIGVAFGDRDHTTIIYGVKKIRRLSMRDDELRGVISSVAAELGYAA